MGDRAVRKHSLDRSLRQRHEIAEHHRRHGKSGDHRLPGLVGMRKCDIEHPDQCEEPGGLDPRGHEAGDRRRRAVVDVRDPHVERHRRYLEPHPDQEKAESDLADDRERRSPCLARADRGERGAAGGAPDQRNSVEQKGRGEGSDQEIFEGRLRREHAAPVEPRQDIDRDRHHLEPEEEDDQVLGPGQKHHPDRGEEHEGVVLGSDQPFPLEVPQGKKDRRRGRHENQRQRGEAEAVHCHHERRPLGTGAAGPEQHEGERARDQTRESDVTGEPAVRRRLVPPGIHQQDDERPRGEGDLGHEGQGDPERCPQIERHQGRAPRVRSERSSAAIGPRTVST